jgi:hypothetical protein
LSGFCLWRQERTIGIKEISTVSDIPGSDSTLICLSDLRFPPVSEPLSFLLPYSQIY